MFTKPIDIGPIDEGLDRKNLALIKKRFLHINEARLDRVFDAIAERQRPCLQILPLLFHVNHPMFPGYVSHQTPAGVDGYTPDKDTLRSAKKFSRSFNFSSSSSPHGRPRKSNAIESIFLMGSIGTIAHTKKSDLDCWICHSDQLNRKQLKELNIKAQLISDWARGYSLDIHFFVMNARAFRNGENLPISAEASGNTQHYLLLDEFYRSSVVLAGRLPLWWFVPSQCESDYKHFTQTLLDKRFLPENDVIDLGGVGTIPPHEFISAGLWQLYKAIDSPYKSVFKLVLLETYASELPHIRTLSLDYKQCIYSGVEDLNLLDPYILTYQRVENYLNQRRERERLALAQRCFYFKANKRLSHNSRKHLKPWQREIIQSLVESWDWQDSHLRHLDNPGSWSIHEAQSEHKAIIAELNRGYQFLLNVEQHSSDHNPFDLDELNVLGNKLKAKFSRRHGKIDSINLGLDLQLDEDHLVFNETYDDAGRRSWHLHAQTLREFASFPEKPVHHCHSLCELITWALHNQVLLPHSQVDVVLQHSNVTSFQVIQTARSLVKLLPLQTEKTPHDNFAKAATITDVVITLNLESEPAIASGNTYIQLVGENSDALNYGADNSNLVRSVDIVLRNSWDEIESHHFSDNALIHSLSFYLQKLADQNSQSQQRPSLHTYCGTDRFGNIIKQRVHALFNDAATAQIFEATRYNCRYIFMAEDTFYCCEKTHSHRVRQFNDEDELLEYLSKPSSNFQRLCADDHLISRTPLSLLASVCEKPSIQVVYSIRGTHANTHILDEKGSLFVAHSQVVDATAFLQCLHHFIRDYIQQQGITTPAADAFGVFPVEFHHHDFNDFGHEFLKPTYISTNIQSLNCHTVAAEVFEDDDQALWFRLHIDDQEFSAENLGESLYSHAVNTVSNPRKAQRFYVTQIDIQHCPALLYQRGGSIQLSHYLAIKQHIEEQLNAPSSQPPQP